MKNAAPNSIAGASTLTGLSKGSGSGTSAMPTIFNAAEVVNAVILTAKQVFGEICRDIIKVLVYYEEVNTVKKIIGVACLVIFVGGLLFGCNRNTTYQNKEVLKNQEVNQEHSIKEDTQNKLQDNEGNDKKQIISSLNDNLFNPNFDNIDKLLKLNKEEAINWLGNDYEIKDAGAEGQEKGYYFEKYGLTVIFDEDNTLMILSAYCDQKVDINGAHLGMTFSDIEEKLGVTEIRKLNVFEPNQSNYAIIYDYGNWHVWFGADEKKSPTTAMEIRNWQFK